MKNILGGTALAILIILKSLKKEGQSIWKKEYG